MIKTIFRSAPPSTAKAAEIIARLEGKLADARTALARAQSDYGAAVVLFEEQADSGAVGALDRARKALEKAELDVKAAEVATVAAKARHGDALQAEEKAKVAQQWDATLKHAAERLTATQDVERAVSALAVSWARLVKTSADIKASSPTPLVDGGDLHGFLVQEDSLSAALRLHLLKCGIPGIVSWPFPTHELPTLVERIGKVDEILLRLRDEQR